MFIVKSTSAGVDYSDTDRAIRLYEGNKLKMYRRFSKDPQKFVTTYFNAINEFIGKHLPADADVHVYGEDYHQHIYFRDVNAVETLTVANQIALYLENMRDCMVHYRGDKARWLADKVLELKYLYYWNKRNLRSDILDRDLARLFDVLGSDIDIESDIYSEKQLNDLYEEKMAKFLSQFNTRRITPDARETVAAKTPAAAVVAENVKGEKMNTNPKISTTAKSRKSDNSQLWISMAAFAAVFVILLLVYALTNWL